MAAPAKKASSGTVADAVAAAHIEPLPLYLVRGDDASLLSDAVKDLLRALVGDDDPSLVVEEHGGRAGEEIEVGSVVDALSTPPFLVARRVVVVREAGRLVAADSARVVTALETAAPGVILVLAGGGGAISQSLSKLAQKIGAVLDSSAGNGRARGDWLAEHLKEGPVRLDPAAGVLVGNHLGADVSRLRGLLESLASAYGPGAKIGVDDLRPFLGEAGGAAPWDLTDALDKGDAPKALDVLSRLIGPGGFHPLAILTVLHKHYEMMLRLDGAGVRSAEDAAALIGARSVYPVKKAMEQGSRLGAARIGRAITLLAAADLDLRGRTALPADLIVEVLVARLARLGATRMSPQRASAQRGPSH